MDKQTFIDLVEKLNVEDASHGYLEIMELELKKEFERNNVESIVTVVYEQDAEFRSGYKGLIVSAIISGELVQVHNLSI